jgi:hypothetical protein
MECAQLGLEVSYKRSKRKGKAFNFHKFWNKKVQWKKHTKKKTLVFENYNFMGFMEFEALIF